MRLAISRTCRVIGVLGILALIVTGCLPLGKPPVDPKKPVVNDPPPVVKLQAGDRVKLDLAGGGLNILPREELVKEDGTINVEQIGAIKVAGLTAREAEIVIQTNLVPNYYKAMTVTLTPTEQFYFVGGQVTHPGAQHYAGRTTVTKAVQSAGDFTDFANRKNIQLTRVDGSIERIDYDEATRNPAKDLEVFPHDKITVDRRW